MAAWRVLLAAVLCLLVALFGAPTSFGAFAVLAGPHAF